MSNIASTMVDSPPIAESPKARYTRHRVLLVEDAPDAALVMSSGLESEGFSVDVAVDGETALEQLGEFDSAPLAVILDLGLPGIDGFETCRRIRETSDVHIIILTARSDEADKLVGFTIGADDYVTKPVSTRELGARVRSVARRSNSGLRAPVETARTPAPQPTKVPMPLTIDALSRTVSIGEIAVQLTRTEFALFRELAQHPDNVVTRADLQAVVWGPDWRGGGHLVEVHMSNLRRKLADAGAGWLIRTVREVGYRLNSSER